MVQKHLIPASLPFVFAIGAVSQDVFATVDLYSKSDCGRDPNDLDVLSTSLIVTHKADDPNSNVSDCAAQSITLADWPKTDGIYDVYIDASTIAEGCSFHVYAKLDSNEQLEGDARCLSPRLRLAQSNNCVHFPFYGEFGHAYCCGSSADCPSDWTPYNSKRSISSERPPAFVRDVTKSKRSGLMERVTKRDACNLVVEDTPRTHYGNIQEVGSTYTCHESVGCKESRSASVGTTVSDGYSIEASVDISLFEIVSTHLGGGYMHEESETTTFTTSYDVPFPYGLDAIATFQPLMSCATAHFEGDCPDVVGMFKDIPVLCTPVLLTGNEPKGHWDVLVDA
ncbi:hypothetical protein F5Y09DRAFT_350590 [Xylaria sp. FL1042]|nr:hypothetical protein F5Y09DRAFT_350590 [Xylaria sp. FL1042]